MLASSVLLHEGGHLFGFALTREPVPYLCAVPAGLTLSPRRPLSYRHELVITLLGPLANLAAAFPLLLYTDNPAIVLLGAINLFTAIANLLPLGGNDGERILGDLLALHLSPALAARLTHAVSFFCFVFLLFFALFLLLSPGGGAPFLLLATLLLRVFPSHTAQAV